GTPPAFVLSQDQTLQRKLIGFSDCPASAKAASAFLMTLAFCLVFKELVYLAHFYHYTYHLICCQHIFHEQRH
ncbi:hypothetical protein P4499_15225, partial [Geobacillus kaustophilus]|nr:hypothetical protein [Geobacillus kaustophilus]